jgi:hypothetical protein
VSPWSAELPFNTIPLLEARASSENEDIVTTTEALFRYAQLDGDATDPATKETVRNRSAPRLGIEAVTARGLTTAAAVQVCSKVTGIEMGVRALPATARCGQR